MMELRKYQKEAVQAILNEWNEGHKNTLLVLPTGLGKTVCFSEVAKQRVDNGGKVLVLAHREELLNQAADKIKMVTGLNCAYEKAERTAFGADENITVGSVQTLSKENRLNRFPKDFYSTIIVDEAHHCLANTYKRILNHFKNANVLGVTATPDRGDKQELSGVFDSKAYEYSMREAIQEKYLSPIVAKLIPLKMDIRNVGISNGDFSAGDIDNAIEPYLHNIAKEIKENYSDRKILIFLPLVKTAQLMRDYLIEEGVLAAEVDGKTNAEDRENILKDFRDGKYTALCNSMLLTEGWDCPCVDCVIVLRPTKIRSLYCLDEATEVLTKDGWKSNVKVGELVAAFDKDTNKIKYVPALATVRRKLEPEECFYSIQTPSVDIRVTNKHRMVYDNKRKINWKIKTIEEIAKLKDGVNIPISGTMDHPGIPLTDSEIKFIGWFMTDGNLNKYNNAITISQSAHQPWFEQIPKCIEECGMKYGQCVNKAKTQFVENGERTVFTISYGQPRGRDKDKRGWAYLAKYIDKNISDALFDMTDEQFDVLIETMHYADGHKSIYTGPEKKTYSIAKGNKVFIERLQILAITHGYKANVTMSTSSFGNPLYYLHMKKKSRACIGSKYDGRPTWVKEEHSDEYCWCVQNELGTLITRRNGKVAIVGNCQMVGRGTRLCEGKNELLLLDFLWLTERHDLCHPASLVARNAIEAEIMTEHIKQNTDGVDLLNAEQFAIGTIAEQRERALANHLKKLRGCKTKTVDPLQYFASIQAFDLTNYVPTFKWEHEQPTEKQLQTLEKYGINSGLVTSRGLAKVLLDQLIDRSKRGLATPKQIRCLERFGFVHVGTWKFEEANNMISRIAANNWFVPLGITPETYKQTSIKRNTLDPIKVNEKRIIREWK